MSWSGQVTGNGAADISAVHALCTESRFFALSCLSGCLSRLLTNIVANAVGCNNQPDAQQTTSCMHRQYIMELGLIPDDNINISNDQVGLLFEERRCVARPLTHAQPNG